MKVKIGKPILIYSPPNTPAINQWGVYSIPKMWKEPDGSLVVRFNGEKDDGLTKQCVPNLYFISKDNGESWTLAENAENKYDLSVLMGINPPYLTCKNGEILSVRYKDNCLPIQGVKHIKEYIQPCGASLIKVYQYGDIPDECKGIELVRNSGKKTTINFDFPEREIAINAKGRENGEFIDLPEYVQSNIFWSPYFVGMTELDDGTLVALSHGQNPKVSDRQCEEIYMVASTDNGESWKKRSVVATDTHKYPFGYGGDGCEISLTKAEDGTLFCAMRMEMSTRKSHFCDTMLCYSKDNGFTWSEPKSVADSSVTPHIMALNGALVLVYGRPGVHVKVSFNNGETWSEPYTLVGKTLDECRALGRSDYEFKYEDMDSYSNTFVEKISDDTMLVLYNDLKYDDGDGKNHKAAFVRKITIEKQ